MKKLVALIVFMVFLCLPISIIAGDCERYWDEIVGQCLSTNIDDVEYTVCFGDSVSGPCPSGVAMLSYSLMQVVSDIEYAATIEINCGYHTTSKAVIIGGTEFVLVDNRLIILPEDFLFLNLEEKE